MPKIHPPLEITEDRRAAIMLWGWLLIGSRFLSAASLLALLSYMVITGLKHQLHILVVANWYAGSELTSTALAFICTYQMSRMIKDEHLQFRPRDWIWMSVRPVLVALLMYAVWSSVNRP